MHTSNNFFSDFVSDNKLSNGEERPGTGERDVDDSIRYNMSVSVCISVIYLLTKWED